MSLSDDQQNEHVVKFLELLDVCYDGNLKTFSNELSNYDETFYEKIKKEVQRAKKGSVSLKKVDTFKKYNFFLEYKLWEKTNNDLKEKRFGLKVDSLIKIICK